MSDQQGKYAIGLGRPGRGYEIVPRPAELRGGWRLTLLENGQETGGVVFPILRRDPQAGMEWWNALTKEQREHWLMMSASAIPADAYRAYLLAEAYADARAEGEKWMAARED